MNPLNKQPYQFWTTLLRDNSEFVLNINQNTQAKKREQKQRLPHNKKHET